MSLSIPVLTFHSVRPDGPMTPTLFELYLSWLVENHYRTVNCQEVFDHISGQHPISTPAVQLTFDDGWLDNWIYAFPLLKKYGLKATIFLISSRIEEAPQHYRPNLEDVWHKRVHGHEMAPLRPATEAFLDAVQGSKGRSDFLTWQEINTMQNSGLIEFQSHSHFHAYYFRGPTIREFNWKRHWRIAWATDGDFRTGIPEYEGGSALMTRRYFDPVVIRDLCHQKADELENGDRIHSKKARQHMNRQLFNLVRRLPDSVWATSSYEPEEHYHHRVVEELRLSRQTIENHTDRSCRFLCWPWGEYSPESIHCATEAGFWGAYSLDRGPNGPGTPPGAIRRFIVRPKSPAWLASRLILYKSSLLARLYQKLGP